MRDPGTATGARGAALGVAVLALAAATSRAEPPLAVAVTIRPLSMLVEAIAGPRAAVTTLVPPGASPHVFEPQPGDLARLAGARVLIEVGGDLDAWAAVLRGAGEGDLERVILLETEGLEPLPAGDGHGGAARPDPHVWLDPIRVRDVLAPALAERFAVLDPADRAGYTERLAAFRAELGVLDAELRQMLAGRGRRFLAFHAAWRYFAARYGLEEVGVVAEAPGEEPTPRALAALIDAARRSGVQAILVEPQLTARVAEVLAGELGLEVVAVDPQGDPGDPERASYPALMRWNARAFARALGGAAP